MPKRLRRHFLLVLFHFGIEFREVAVTWKWILRSSGWYGPYWWYHNLIWFNYHWYITPGECHYQLTTFLPQQRSLRAILIGCFYHIDGHIWNLKWWMWPSPDFFSCLYLSVGGGRDTLIVWGQSSSWFLLYCRHRQNRQVRILRVFRV